MTSMAAKYAAKKLLGDRMNSLKNKDVAGDDDPYFAYIQVKGKKKKVKRQIPDFIPANDHHILVKVKDKAYSQDMGFGIGTFRFGWDSVLGFILPEVGDIIGVLMSLNIYRLCCGVEGGLPLSLRTRMLVHIVIDGTVGLIPILGDVFDGIYKANTKNVRLLEKYLIEKHMPRNSDRNPDTVGFELFEDDPDYAAAYGSAEFLAAGEKQRASLKPGLQAEFVGGENIQLQQNRTETVQKNASPPKTGNQARFDGAGRSDKIQPAKKSRWSFFGGGRDQKQQDPEQGHSAGGGQVRI